MIKSRKNLQHTVCVQVSCISTIKLSVYNTQVLLFITEYSMFVAILLQLDVIKTSHS